MPILFLPLLLGRLRPLALIALLPAACTAAEGRQARPPRAVLLAASVLAEMNIRFEENNAHWDELADLNTLEQMLGTVRPTQREYLGCLIGAVDGDTVRVRGVRPAHGLKQLQFAAAGSCEGVDETIGTWHTHPYRADGAGHPLKERQLSARDLATFTEGGDALLIAVWDRDSVDAAIRAPDGAVLHPARVVVR